MIVHVLAADGSRERRDLGRGVAIVGAAVAPDLDLLLSLVDGRSHHQAQSHSLGMAIAAGLVAAVAARALRQVRPAAFGLATGLAWCSHVLLDYLGSDTSPPIGIMALWPFSSEYYHFPWPLFLDIGRTLEWSTVRNDGLAAAWEALILLPVLSLTWRWKTRPKD